MSPILHYLQLGQLPPNEGEAIKIRNKAAKYTILSRKLYRMGKATTMLRCLGKDDITLVLAEVHKGVCINHIDGKAITHKLLRAEHYCGPLQWKETSPSSRSAINSRDTLTFTTPSHWPFYQWGMDNLGAFPLGPGQLNILIMGVDYFTKWIEARQWLRSRQKECDTSIGRR